MKSSPLYLCRSQQLLDFWWLWVHQTRNSDKFQHMSCRTKDVTALCELALSYTIQNQPSTGVLRKIVVLEICSKFTGENPCRSVIPIKLLYNFIEIALCHGCSIVNLLHIFWTPFPKNTSGRLLLTIRE